MAKVRYPALEYKRKCGIPDKSEILPVSFEGVVQVLLRYILGTPDPEWIWVYQCKPDSDSWKWHFENDKSFMFSQNGHVVAFKPKRELLEPFGGIYDIATILHYNLFIDGDAYIWFGKKEDYIQLLN